MFSSGCVLRMPIPEVLAVELASGIASLLMTVTGVHYWA